MKIPIASSIFCLLSSTLVVAAPMTVGAQPKIAVPTVSMAIPVDSIWKNVCPTAATYSPEIVIKFSGVKIDDAGKLVLKRNIRFKDAGGGDNEGPADSGVPVPDTASASFSIKTPFDINTGTLGGNNLLPIKVVLRKGIGAQFITEKVNNINFAYIRAGDKQGALFCGLTEIEDKPGRYIFRFFVLPTPGTNYASYAVGIIVPEVNSMGVATDRYLPLIIDPNVKNEG